MNDRLGSFDRLASAYKWLEYLALGDDLERARFHYLDHLHGCQRVLILGEGDGRFLARLIRKYPSVHVDCVDASSRMLAKARGRLSQEECARVNFRHVDARFADLCADNYDAVVTMFFLDCFSTEDVVRLIHSVKLALRKDARWLWADFTLPAHGWRRWRALLWLHILYCFFRWQTGLAVCRLPPTESLLGAAGFILRREKSLQAGLLRSAVYSKS